MNSPLRFIRTLKSQLTYQGLTCHEAKTQTMALPIIGGLGHSPVTTTCYNWLGFELEAPQHSLDLEGFVPSWRLCGSIAALFKECCESQHRHIRLQGSQLTTCFVWPSSWSFVPRRHRNLRHDDQYQLPMILNH